VYYVLAEDSIEYSMEKYGEENEESEIRKCSSTINRVNDSVGQVNGTIVKSQSLKNHRGKESVPVVTVVSSSSSSMLSPSKYEMKSGGKTSSSVAAAVALKEAIPTLNIHSSPISSTHSSPKTKGIIKNHDRASSSSSYVKFERLDLNENEAEQQRIHDEVDNNEETDSSAIRKVIQVESTSKESINSTQEHQKSSSKGNGTSKKNKSDPRLDKSFELEGYSFIFERATGRAVLQVRAPLQKHGDEVFSLQESFSKVSKHLQKASSSSALSSLPSSLEASHEIKPNAAGSSTKNVQNNALSSSSPPPIPLTSTMKESASLPMINQRNAQVHAAINAQSNKQNNIPHHRRAKSRPTRMKPTLSEVETGKKVFRLPDHLMSAATITEIRNTAAHEAEVELHNRELAELDSHSSQRVHLRNNTQHIHENTSTEAVNSASSLSFLGSNENREHERGMEHQKNTIGVDSPDVFAFERVNSNGTNELRLDMRGETVLKERTVCFFDWDDTLLPSSYLRKSGAVMTNDGRSLNGTLKRKLMDIERLGIDLLQASLQYGAVTLITNSTSAWLNLSLSRFMPRMKVFLEQNQIRFVSARRLFVQQFPDSPTRWKVEAFLQELRHYNEHSSFLNVIVFGDSMSDLFAGHVACRQMKNSNIKVVKLMDWPNLDQLIKELKFLRLNIDALVRHHGSVDVSIEFESETEQSQSKNHHQSHTNSVKPTNQLDSVE